MIRAAKILTVLVATLTMQSGTSGTTCGDTTVYICVTGKVYHAYKDCRGLSNATHKIKAVPLSEAQKTRRACKICY